MSPPRYPSLYQINTRVWLRELSRRLGRPATLDDVPDDALGQLRALGFDWVWLLGVWQTGEAGREVSLRHPGWRQDYQALLPDWQDRDVTGSPFAVRSYAVHLDYGGNQALRRLRERLRGHGLRLLLDFVPNHVAPDHPWVWERPEFFIPGDDGLLAREPENYRRVETRHGPRVLAHGRDPYFPGWPDTLQLNYRHAGLRAAMTEELTRIAGACDGLRCDMAMLLLPEVIHRTWHDLSRPRDGSAPVDTPFWPEAIAHVRRAHPDFLFMAEVYWDLEWTLQQQGFEYTYDKRLYDRLHLRDAAGVRGHLRAELSFQERLVRFLENHDEPRAAAAFPPRTHEAAAVLTFLAPGLRFLHEGQLEGRTRKVSVHLGRRPDEPVNQSLQDFYRRLIEVLARPEVRNGRWRLLDCRIAWDGNQTWSRFLAYAWEGPAAERLLVCVNYGTAQGQCYINLPFDDLRGKAVLLGDLLGPARYERAGDDLATRGLYLDLPAWGYHVFAVSCS